MPYLTIDYNDKSTTFNTRADVEKKLNELEKVAIIQNSVGEFNKVKDTRSLKEQIILRHYHKYGSSQTRRLIRNVGRLRIKNKNSPSLYL